MNFEPSCKSDKQPCTNDKFSLISEKTPIVQKESSSYIHKRLIIAPHPVKSFPTLGKAVKNKNK